MSRVAAALLFVLIVLALGSLPPRTARGDEPAAGVLTRVPAVLAPAVPEYPAEAKAAGVAGVVELEIEISEIGVVTDAVVTRPAGHGLDEAALAAARKLVFSPAEVDGKPSPVRIEYRFAFTLAPVEQAPPRVNLRGRVRERGTREPVVGARVEAGGRHATTGPDGTFEIAGVPEGDVQVKVTEAAHESVERTEQILAGQATEVSYWIARTAADPYETVVVSSREKNEVAHVAISSGEVRRVPGVSGDAVKVIQNLPGVARPVGGSGELVVRGGNARDTRVYVDGREVPEIFHFGGLTSIYSSELIDEVEFEAGNFGVRYGRAIGGRVNLRTRDPGEKTHALADVNLYHATALVEGRPREDLGLAIAARRSYVDAVMGQAMRGIEDAPSLTVAPRYYDLQAKLAWKASEDDVLRLDVFGSDDRMVLGGLDFGTVENLDSLSLSTRFWAASARWRRRVSEDTRLELSVGGGVSGYDTRFGSLFSDREHLPTYTARAELYHALDPRVRLVAGVDGLAYLGGHIMVTAPPIPAPGQVPAPEAPLQHFDETFDAGEGGAFLEATIEPVGHLFLVPGVRADFHHTVSTLTWVDPRVAVRWEADGSTAIKAAAGLYHQAPPVVYMTEQWGNPDLGPEGAWQYSMGFERRVGAHVSTDVQVYYKRLFDLALPTDGTIVRDGVEVAERYASAGTGKAYGVELLVRWDPDGRFFGWVAYSLSRSLRDQAVSAGRLVPEGDAYDQPHNLVVVGTWELPELWRGLSAGFRLRYTSGTPYEAIHGAIYDADADAWQPIATGRATSRTPPFLQLDLRADRRWTFRTWSFTAYLELQNALNRKNVEGVAYSADYSQHGWATGLPLFPAFGLRAEY